MSILVIFFDVNKLAWQAKQSIPHTTLTSYGDYVRMCEDIALNFGNKDTGYCIMTTHRLTLSFSPGNFLTKNNKTVVLHPPYLYLFPGLKIKLKGHHFNTTEVIEGELQEVLNTLTVTLLVTRCI
jgi:hypothetical protein